MEQEILSWLNGKYEIGKETDVILKESLWNDFANDRDVNLTREDFFTSLGRCISQSSLKEIKVTRCKGKRNAYRGLRKKQGQNSLHLLTEFQRVPSTSCGKESDGLQESEKGGAAANDLVTKNDGSPHTYPNQDVNYIVKLEENDVQSCDVYSQRKDKEGSSLEDRQISSAKERGFRKDNAPEEAVAMHKRGRDDEKGSSEKRRGDAKVPSNANLDDGQISSEKERGVCQEKPPEKEAGTMHKKGRFDKNTHADDAEVPFQISSGNKGEACQEYRLEEDASPLIDNLEAEDSMFEKGACGTGLKDAEEWTDDQSDSVVENVRSPKSNNPSSGSSSSSTVGCCPSKVRKRQTKHRSKRRTVLVSSDEEEHSPERFYRNHHKKLKSLLPKYRQIDLGRFGIICARSWTFQRQTIQDELTFITIQVLQETMNVLFAGRLLLQPSLLSMLVG